MPFPGVSLGDDWMKVLAAHYSRVRARYPQDELAIVFDIDGTILDLRYLMAHVLLAYDRARGTDLFHGIVAADITVPENQVDVLLETLDVPDERRDDIAGFYRLHLWDDDGIQAASAPYRGVLSVIRWFQIQPGTSVALNTGRSERMRRITLDSLNAVGRAARVRFEPELLFMRGGAATVHEAKAAALDELDRRGFRLVAVIDNEPANLTAMQGSRPGDEILFLHADTMFESQRRDGLRVVRGSAYDLGGLISEDRLREHVDLVWHGVNDDENLQQFLRSGINWAEVDVRFDPVGRLVARHDGYDERAWNRDEPSISAGAVVGSLTDAGRSIKVDVKGNEDTSLAALDLLDDLGLSDDRVWFNGEIDVVGSSAFEAFRGRYPAGIASCPVDFLMPLLTVAPQDAGAILERLRSWGMSRLSVRWGAGTRRAVVELERRGWETNIYAVPDLQSFLEAAVLLPTSVTADFNFPAWRYFGRGSGEHGSFHRYEAGAVLGAGTV